MGVECCRGRIFQGFPEPIIRKISEHLLQATYTCATAETVPQLVQVELSPLL